MLAEIAKAIIDQPALMYSGVRKIVQAVNWEVKKLPEISFEQLGYGKNKFGQLQRIYWNPVEVARIQAILERRADQSFTSVAMSMRNGTKDARSMGWCMNSMVITRIPRVIETVEIQYRSTEATLKFGGDLAFLPWAFNQLGLKPDLIRFRFANAYLSGVFMPTLCTFWDPIKFFDYLWKHDRKLFAGGTRFFLRSAYRRNQSFPYSPENVQHKFAWAHLDMKLIRDYLHQKHKQIGKPLPKAHHPIDDNDD